MGKSETLINADHNIYEHKTNRHNSYYRIHNILLSVWRNGQVIVYDKCTINNDNKIDNKKWIDNTFLKNRQEILNSFLVDYQQILFTYF